MSYRGFKKQRPRKARFSKLFRGRCRKGPLYYFVRGYYINSNEQSISMEMNTLFFHCNSAVFTGYMFCNSVPAHVQRFCNFCNTCGDMIF